MTLESVRSAGRVCRDDEEIVQGALRCWREERLRIEELEAAGWFAG